MEEEAWDQPPCGRCEPKNRMLTRAADGLWLRCPTCHPYWNYDPDPSEMRTAPLGHDHQIEVIKQMRYRFPLLRLVPSEELRFLMRQFFEAGWFAVDVLYALDHDAEGNPVFLSKPTGSASGEQVAKWVKRRLDTWRDNWDEPLKSRSQTAVEMRENALAQAEATRIDWDELSKRAVRPVESVGHSLALREARIAAGLAARRRREGERRELEARRIRIEKDREAWLRRRAMLDALANFIADEE